MQEPVFSPHPIDRLGISRYGMAITDRSRVLLVLGRTDTDLQNHANELLAWLRQARPKLHAEMVPAIEGEQLIQRFNDMLAGLSIEAAVRPDQPTPPERLWILRDDNQLREPEVRLLAKLQQQFPAARLSSVILSRHPDRFSGLLKSDERGLISWTLPGVNLAPLDDWLAEPADSPLPPASARRPAPEATPRPSPPPPAPKKPTPKTAPPQKGGLRKTLMGLVLGFVTSTTLVVGGLLWLHTQEQLYLVPQWLGMATQAPRPAAKTPAAPTPAPAAQPPASQAPTDPPASAEAQAPGNPTANGPATAGTGDAGKPAESPAKPAAEVAPAKAGKEPTKPAAPDNAAASPDKREARDSDGRAPSQADPRVPPPVPAAAREGQRWAERLPADNVLVVHGRFDRLAEAQQLIQRHEYLKNARVLPAGTQLMVVTGPFQSEARAQSYLARLQLKDAQVMPVGKLKAR